MDPFLERSEIWLNLSTLLPQLRHLTLAKVLADFTFQILNKIFSLLSCIPQLLTLELKGWEAKWLDYFVTNGPLAPPPLDIEPLRSQRLLLGTDIPAPNPANNESIHGNSLTRAPEFLPNLRLFIILRADEETSELFLEPDLQLALWRILRARPQLLLHYYDLFMTAGTGNVEEGEALIRESMDLGHVRFCDRGVDGHIYSGEENEIII
ncbi:hypothetical protein DL93DRAFT_1779504 [Clavulina sp. PMI_390]|nr:hypothetical protein DL93DRAFT_1779504 [Clavulina sp. PMI_390]